MCASAARQNFSATSVTLLGDIREEYDTTGCTSVCACMPAVATAMGICVVDSMADGDDLNGDVGDIRHMHVVLSLCCPLFLPHLPPCRLPCDEQIAAASGFLDWMLDRLSI